ncbi:phage tail terminator family protein [Wukongibacter sp. M2B1]|uniref:phage tail terminator family protein n=1 Tax=Wukongibacter sp. M2B1 TaxID=3088895 RepID=UPI003D7B3BB2
MITYSDIVTAINTKIELKFPNIEIQSTDVEEGFSRPSFFIPLNNIKTSDFMNFARDRTITVRIYYFPTDRYSNQIEILEMQDSLEEAFIDDNEIQVNEDFIIGIYESEIEIVDGVLQFEFEIFISEEYDSVDNEVETMEDLQITNI